MLPEVGAALRPAHCPRDCYSGRCRGPVPVWRRFLYPSARKVPVILCLPLLNRAKLIGVLYLENNLTPRVFAPARILVLKLLTSQAAIALENAHLYRDLAEREKKQLAATSEALLHRLQRAERPSVGAGHGGRTCRTPVRREQCGNLAPGGQCSSAGSYIHGEMFGDRWTSAAEAASRGPETW